MPLAWLTAIVAAVGGVTAVADQQQQQKEVAIAFALLTALLAATNAALRPSETARAHRTAALAYERVRLKLDDLAYFEVGEWGKAVPHADLTRIVARLKELDEEINGIAGAGPGVAQAVAAAPAASAPPAG